MDMTNDKVCTMNYL